MRAGWRGVRRVEHLMGMVISVDIRDDLPAKLLIDAYATAARAMGLEAPAWLEGLSGYAPFIVDSGGSFARAPISRRSRARSRREPGLAGDVRVSGPRLVRMAIKSGRLGARSPSARW